MELEKSPLPAATHRTVVEMEWIEPTREAVAGTFNTFLDKAKMLSWPWIVALTLSHLYAAAALVAAVTSEETAPDGLTPLTSDQFAYRFPPVGGLSVVYELDLLVATMLSLTLWHAAFNEQAMLATAGVGLGFRDSQPSVWWHPLSH